MNRLKITLSFVLKAILWGGLLGAGLGAIAPILFFFFSPAALFVAPYGAIFGAMLGVPLGLLNGFIAAVVTLVYFYPPSDEKRYRVTMLTAARVITVCITAVAYYPLFDSMAETWFFLLWVVEAAVIAGFGASWVSERLSNGYLKASQVAM